MSSYKKSGNQFQLEERRIFLLVESDTGHPFVFSSPSINVSDVTAEVFGALLLEERTSDEWSSLFSALGAEKI